MTRYWLISDMHLGHEKLSREGLAHKRRPANVDTLIARNWDQLVSPEDVVIDLGDVCFGFVDINAWLMARPGHKILVTGNHDPHGVAWYMARGYSYACDGLLQGGVWYTHRPDPILPTGARVNVHGHCHNRFPRGLRYYPHCRLFSLEYENYMPRLIISFLGSIDKEIPYVREEPVDRLDIVCAL